MRTPRNQTVSEPPPTARLPMHPASQPVVAKILAVDDNPRNLLAVKEMLQAPAVEIVTAESGKAALRHVLREEFAAILLDVQMPEMDGYEVAQLIRARPHSARVPILFLTAFNKDDVQVFRGYNAGAVDYIFKPIEPLILQSKVQVFVDLYRKTEEIRRQAAEERRLLTENLQVRTEKLKTEQMLRRREEHQSIVLKSLPIALFTAALKVEHRELRFTNDGIEALTGFAPKAFLEEGFWSSRLHPEDRDQALAQLGQVLDTGAVSLEYRWRCSDNSYRCFLDHVVLGGDEDGSPREIFGMWFDITERKQLELNLLHASKLEAVGRLTGGIAHDFNNMLSVVIGNLDLLRKTVSGNDKAERRIKMAIESAQHCAALTSRLLAFSRRQALQATAIDLGAVMPGLMELMRRTLGENIRLQLKAPKAVWAVQADQPQLEAAVLNLAVNARDAMPDGGELTIAIDNRTVEDPERESDYVVIAVSDTGIGMPAHVRERVFEPFFTTKSEGKGTGLGLSTVYGFAQQSGGHVEIDSTEGEGTTVRILLRRAEADAMPLKSDVDAEPVAPFGEGAAVLVVEDDPNVRQVAVSTLGSLGFTVTEAGTADEAAEILEGRGDFRLVFSEVRMPGRLNGVDLAGLIRQTHPAVPVLLTTGYVESSTVLEGQDVLYKPYRAAELAERIRSLVSQAGDGTARGASGLATAFLSGHSDELGELVAGAVRPQERSELDHG